jgi:hypothetical protein
LVTGWVGTGILFAKVGEQELVMACAFGTIDTASSGWHKLAVLLVEGCVFENEKDVGINPELKIADGQEDALLFSAATLPVLPKASGERCLLLVGLELRQQEGMSDTNLLGVESIDHGCGEVGEFDASGDIGWALARLRGDLLDAVLRLLQIEERAKAQRLFERMYVAPLQVLNLSLVLQKLSMTSMTMTFCTLWNPYL